MAKKVKETKWLKDRAYPRYVRALMDMKSLETQAAAVIQHIGNQKKFEAYNADELERIRDVAQQVLDALRENDKAQLKEAVLKTAKDTRAPKE
jgi:hypothetical protein